VKWLERLVPGGCAVATLAWCATASAQPCVNAPSFVPGLSGPPLWTGAAGVVRKDLNDPRWAAAPLTRFPQDPTGMEAAYRVLKNGQELNVSLHAITDPALNANDAIYFGFSEGGTVAHLVRINLPGSGVEPISPAIFHAWDRSAGGWTDTGAVQPAWLRDPGVWRTAAVAPTNPGDPGYEAVRAGVAWGVNFKVDLHAGALTTDFRVFLGMHVTTSASPIDYYLPDYPGSTTLVTGTIVPDASDTAWQSVTALNTPCTGGVNLAWGSIGSTNTPSSAIDISPNSVNVFYADPTGIPAPMDAKVLAKFRIARWGSTIADPLAPWTDLPGATAVSSADGAPHVHTFTCTPPSGGTCPVLGAGEDPHQCVLVELRPGPNGAGLQFEQASAYRNMDFEDLSTLTRSAQINVKGLQTLTGQAKDRDVYIYVKESNMPALGPKPLWLPGKRMYEAKRFAEAPPPRPRPERPDGGKNEKEKDVGRLPAKPAPEAARPPKPVAPKGPPAPPVQPGQPAAAPAAAAIPAQSPPPKPSEFGAASPHEALVSTWPTYEVHVYYDSGRVVKIDGQDQSVLRPMVPFGFYLAHDGPLYGFTSAFEAENGVILEPIGPNFYHVKVPNEGMITVKTTITAHETGKGDSTQCPQCPPRGRCHCDVPGAPAGNLHWLGALLAAAAVGLRRRKRG
jgi:hypothetical protein